MRRLGTSAQGAASRPLTPPLSTPSSPHRAPGDPGLGVSSEPWSAMVYTEGNIIARKYRLTRIIGQGGMGAVWCARNIALDIDVAIKLIRRDRTPPEAAGRLLQEARAAARLKHPSIVRIFDFGESEQGDPFIAMELLQGEPLSAVLRRKGRLPPTLAVQTLLPVAAALASAHGKGIVHRDLKPDNIFLVNDETGALIPKIVDFGIAKLITTEIDRQVTQAGAVLGSPDYMSPEQARGAENVGEASDIWTFTVLLYETIAGRRPFDGPNYNALIAAILTLDPVPLSDAGVHEPALWSILQRGLAKRIDQRWPTMRDLGAQLAAWAVERGIEDDVAGNPIAKQWLLGAGNKRAPGLHLEKHDGATPAARLSGMGAAMLTPPGSIPSAITGSGGVASGIMAAFATPDDLPPAPPQRPQAAPGGRPLSVLTSPVEPLPAERSWLSMLIIVGGALLALSATLYLVRDLMLGRASSPSPSPSVTSSPALTAAANAPSAEPEMGASEAEAPGAVEAPASTAAFPGASGKVPPRPAIRKFKPPKSASF